jgi:hypothetical protein
MLVSEHVLLARNGEAFAAVGVLHVGSLLVHLTVNDAIRCGFRPTWRNTPEKCLVQRQNRVSPSHEGIAVRSVTGRGSVRAD